MGASATRPRPDWPSAGSRAVRHFFASVAGETYPNRDGTKRQTVIDSCHTGEPIILEPEPDNPQHENAVRVLRKDGRQIGYLERGMAAQLIDNLGEVSAFVAGVDRGGPYLSVSLLMVVRDGHEVTVAATFARQVLKDRLRDQRKSLARRVALILAVVLLVVLEAWWWLAGGLGSHAVRPSSPRRPGRLHAALAAALVHDNAPELRLMHDRLDTRSALGLTVEGTTRQGTMKPYPAPGRQRACTGPDASIVRSSVLTIPSPEMTQRMAGRCP